MLGMRLKEGINIYRLMNEQNWDKKKTEIALSKLLKEWERFLDDGLLVKKVIDFLSDPKGMEFNQILISMFRWWKIQISLSDSTHSLSFAKFFPIKNWSAKWRLLFTQS